MSINKHITKSLNMNYIKRYILTNNETIVHITYILSYGQ